MIRFNCSECDRPFKVADEHAGKSIRCPGCKGVIKVPAEETEEEPAPPPKRKSRAVLAAEDAPVKRKPRLEQEDEEEETPPGRKARLEPEEDEDDTPRRRRDEEDEDDRPRKKKKKKSRKQQDEEVDAKLFIFLSLGLTVLFVGLGAWGWFHRGGAFVMLVVGLVPIAVGTWWIRHIASEESDMAYFACMYVPFYETYFSLSRWHRTWGACLTCWIGRFFVITAVVLLIIHFISENRRGGGGWPVPGPVQTPAEIDADCQRLLKSPDATEARAWLAVPGRRIQGVTVGRLNLQPAVEGLYQQGAVRVTFAEMMIDPDGDDPNHLVVELPAEKEKRLAIVNYVNAQLLEPDDDRQTDKGQKYLLVLTN